MNMYFKSINKSARLAFLTIVIAIALASCTARPATPQNGISTSPDVQTVGTLEAVSHRLL